MKGYFSSIAKISGIRFSGQETRRQKSVSGKSEENPVMPIEENQTVLKSAPVLEPDTKTRSIKADASSQPPPQSGRKPQKNEQKVMRGDKAQDTRITDKPRQVGEPKAPSRKESVPETPTKVRQISTEPGKKIRDPKQSSPLTPPVKKPSDILIESSVKTDAPTDPVKGHQASEQAGISQKPTEKKPGVVYFGETAEMVEKGEAEPREIGEVLVREALEWAADSKPPPEETETIQDIKIENTETREISVDHSDDQEIEAQQVTAAVSEVNRIEEQSLDLSIGKINVIIEETEKKIVEQPAPQTTGGSQDKGESHSGSSRLDRSYI